MQEHKHKWFDCHKPHFNRSNPKVLRGKAAKEVKTSKTGRLSAILSYTKWKIPISKETFNEFVERELLSDEQIKTYLAKYERKKNKTSRVQGKVYSQEEIKIINEISKLDVKTKDGSKAFKKIVKMSPKYLLLLGEAQRIRRIRQK